jgi:thymidylate synthase
MAVIDVAFSQLCNQILISGKEYENKNRGVKRLQIPSYTFRHDLSEGFPAITSKKLFWKSVVGELIWFLRGDTDVEYLNANGIKIWNQDAYNWYVKKYSNNDPIEGQEEHYFKNEDGTYRMFTFDEFEARGTGSVGRNYSAQWRDFNGNTDQISDLVKDMKKDIMSSRLKVNAWNPSELSMTALPPCHSEFQVIGVPLENGEFGFELHWTQRSVDTFLGLPFNIASYALLAKILERLTGYKALAIEGNLKCVHFYDNQYDAAKELLLRDTDAHGNCEVEITVPAVEFNGNLDEILSKYEISHFNLIGYTSEKAIPVKMLAPTK